MTDERPELPPSEVVHPDEVIQERAPALTPEDVTALEAERPGGPPEDWRQRFLEALAIMPNVRAACAMARVSRAHAYRVKAAEPTFAEQWATALEEACDRLEQSAWEKSIEGTERVTETYDDKGRLRRRHVETVHDSRLHAMLRQAHRPEKFAPQLVLKDGGKAGNIDARVEELARKLGVRAGDEPVPQE